VFAAYHANGDTTLSAAGSRIEGIGRPRVEPSFIRGLIDDMRVVSNAESIAAMRILSGLLGRRVGPSTGTNFVAVLELANQMKARGQTGSLLSLICDAGERYLPTYHNEAWVSECMGDCSAAAQRLNTFLA
jgi:cysteine synthase A